MQEMVVCLVTVIGTGQEPQKGQLETASPARLHGFIKIIKIYQEACASANQGHVRLFQIFNQGGFDAPGCHRGVYTQHKYQKIPRMRQ